MTLVLLFNQYAPPTIRGGGVQAQQTGAGALLETVAGTGTATAKGLRTYGRTGQVNGVGGTWVEVTTDANGYSDQVYYTTLIQVLKLNLGESPFYGNYGIPAQQSVITQVFPDYYVMQTQTQFAPYFASLVITRVPLTTTPTYDVTVVCHSGAVLSTVVAT